MKELIEFLEKTGLKTEADSLRNGGTELNPQSNIGTLGAKKLAAALKDNKSLKYLNLIGSYIGEEGARALAEALKDNESLKELYLTPADISTVTLNRIKEYIQRNTDLYYKEQQQYNKQLISSIKANEIKQAESIIPFIDPKYSNSVDENNNTALHYAVDKNLEKLSISLINKMSIETISIGNMYNNTALHYATDNGLEVISWFLINNMTQKALDMVNTDGNTALDYAIHNRHLL
ncbi:ankyrin repeat family protein [Rickettsia felis str. Pedreira]|uniref:Putative ankyrin repeat protein RF_0063 n=2 Tax=Rickettsia felis TaxID=42862 RepID=Y063_RICFE|nr:ankyrin repeat domain-containing protein [Rickettsia felis]Q4UNE4.1 RecName: Full=Putative ankyrin repeat protein RF_0063 [Rickettsia felis URRWXCal2]AAY60914.1 Ankyrin repeat [Rickettsia felis URRWXCal2]KHO03434.1 hypothetical protein JS55_00390 [Rickettsia felis str. LSU]KHO04104.1 hypothetical protein JS61_00400 [Rickettsia felis]KJV58059.1 ankyrin repeat family protein [Rickettsia felis str. Pedreira]MDE8611935.1 ankyrin repeat domain-containing protein [Rickettsia felis]